MLNLSVPLISLCHSSNLFLSNDVHRNTFQLNVCTIFAPLYFTIVIKLFKFNLSVIADFSAVYCPLSRCLTEIFASEQIQEIKTAYFIIFTTHVTIHNVIKITAFLAINPSPETAVGIGHASPATEIAKL